MTKLKKIFFTLTILTLSVFLININKISQVNHFDYKIEDKYFSREQSPYENDFDYIFDSLEKYYPLFERNGTKNFLTKRDVYKKEIKNIKSDDLFFSKMNRILSALGDEHTTLLDKGASNSLKDTFSMLKNENNNFVNIDLMNYLFDNNFSSTNFIDNIFKNSIASTNNLKTQDINKDIAYLRIESMLDTTSNEFNKDLTLLKSYLKKSKNKKALVIDIRGNGGGDSSYTSQYLCPMILGARNYEEPPFYLLFRSKEVFKFDPQWPSLKKSIRKIKISDYDLLEKDISFLNDDRAMMDDIKKNFTYILYYSKAKRRPSINISTEGIKVSSDKNSFGDEYRFNGNLYLLIDKNVYSSAQEASTFFRKNKLGTIIGEKSGGDGIGTSPAMFKLPNSKYIFRMSHQLGLMDANSREESIYTFPDIKVDPKYYSFVNLNDDGCIKEVIKRESNH